MAKHQSKAGIVDSKDQKGLTIETTFNDSLLPDAAEIERLHKIDPDIMQWLKDRAKDEQDFRHKTFNERLKMVSRSDRGSRWINYLGLFFSFVLLSGGMFLSYTLITEGYEILGSIFSGAMLIAIASIFMSKVKSNNSKRTPSR